MSAALTARLFAGLVAVVSLFQLALALGAPWGDLAMGGAFPGTLPPALRLAALAQMAVLAGAALVVLIRAGVVRPGWRRAARWPAWAIVGLLGVSLALNLVTPSPLERMVWAPVVAALFAAALRVALSRGGT